MILALAVFSVCSYIMIMAETSRLPMVAGWDSILPAWFYETESAVSHTGTELVRDCGGGRAGELSRERECRARRRRFR